MNFLVLISELLAFALTLGKLRLIKLSELLLEGLWASRKCQTCKASTYKKAVLI
jgi:hypothetical protein